MQAVLPYSLMFLMVLCVVGVFGGELLASPWLSLPCLDTSSKCQRGHVYAFCLKLGLPCGTHIMLIFWFFCLNTY